MKYIKLRHGLEAIVDDGDFDIVSCYTWHAYRARQTFYASTKVNGQTVYMHRMILGTPDGVETDHIDGNGLNCTRQNMRIATRAENSRNIGKRRNNTSGYKGVIFDKSRGRWAAQITVNYVMKNLGRYTDPIEAALAYDRAARELHGQFARTNFATDI